MAPQLRVAVAGVGALGSIHARILAKLPSVTLSGIFDADPSRAAKIAKEWKTKVFESLDALALGSDACVVAVPTRFHLEVARVLLSRGVHCLVEKPLARTVEEGRELVALAKATGRVLMVGHVERFNPAVVALLAQDLNPRFIEAQRVSPFSFRSTDVGVVLDMMIHDIDLILHLVRSNLESVHAVGVNVVGEHEDIANARLVFENGAVANVTASRVALKTERKLRLFASDVYVTLDFKERSGRIVRPHPKIREQIAKGALDLADASPLEIMLKRLVRTESLDVRGETEPLLAEDSEFVAAIVEGRAPLVTGAHGLLAMEAADRVVHSIRDHLRRA